MSGSQRLAKLTRPRLHDVFPRARLFALLDECLKRPVTWVVGPPGAGKTALVASYLEVREIPGGWYHLDADDRDPATFFHYLSRCFAGKGSRRRDALPVLTNEHLGDITAFARYYFRACFDRLGAPAALVFDNYHDVTANSEVHVALAQAALEVPEGVSVIVISREDPPAEFAGIEASDRLARLDWTALRLTLDEAQSIASLRLALDQATLRGLYEISQGWAAGLTLALERLKRSDGELHEFHAEALESVFNYFAGQIFKTVEPEVREFLMRTALVKRLTPDLAARISGNANAAGILDYFYRRRLFTDRRGVKPHGYQYHDLFRAFLLDRLEQMYTPLGIDELRQRAAQALESGQLYDEAFHLYREARDWEAIERLVLREAKVLLGQGRAGTLRDWIAALPEGQREDSPWMNYWQGVALVELAPHAAVAPLEIAYARFMQRNDLAGQLAAASAAMCSYSIDLKTFRPFAVWVARVRELLAQGVPFASPTVELQVNATMAYYAYQTLGGDFDPEPNLQRAMDLIASGDVPASDKLFSVCLLIEILRESGRLRESARIIELAQPILDSSQTSPDNKAHALCCIAWYYMSRGDNATAWAASLQAEAFRAQHALTAPARHMQLHQGLAAMAWQRGDLALAESHIRHLERFDDPARVLDRAWVHWLKGGVAGAQDNWQEAILRAEHEIDLMIGAGANWFLYFSYLKHAVALTGAGAFAEAYAAAEKSRALIEDTVQFRSLADVDLAEAWVALHAGDQIRFEARVRHAVALLKRTELHACLWYLDARVVPGVLSEALGRGIEVEYVRRMIAQLALAPPEGAGPDWGWAVRIRVLGGFDISRNDRPLESARKAAKRPLALLKVLICAGGDPVPVEQLADWLWPDSEADSARKSLEMTLHRLRTLLGAPGLVRLVVGEVSLDRTRVWVDAWDFALLCRKPAATAADADRALHLYRGRCLPHDLHASWSISYRERLHDNFNRLICLRAGQLERDRQFREALIWYQRGVEADDVVESMYQGIMRCQMHLGQRADALIAFQRLRRTLAVKLKTLPSPESIALAGSAEAA